MVPILTPEYLKFPMGLIEEWFLESRPWVQRFHEEIPKLFVKKSRGSLWQHVLPKGCENDSREPVAESTGSANKADGNTVSSRSESVE